MGYYIRVLGTSNPNIHLGDLVKAISADSLTAKFGLPEEEKPDNWSVISVDDNQGQRLMVIERNPVIAGELGQEELDEFRESVIEYKPESAAQWLLNYFDKVKVIYAFQILNAVENDTDWAIVDCIKTKIWSETNGILQADSEGFSNEAGYHVLWQFNDDAEGEYSMAVLENGTWVNFIMNLDDPTQRLAFHQGQFPEGAKLIA